MSALPLTHSATPSALSSSCLRTQLGAHGLPVGYEMDSLLISPAPFSGIMCAQLPERPLHTQTSA